MSHYLKHAFMAFAYSATAVVFVLWPQGSFVVALTMMAIYLTFDMGTSPGLAEWDDVQATPADQIA